MQAGHLQVEDRFGRFVRVVIHRDRFALGVRSNN